MMACRRLNQLVAAFLLALFALVAMPPMASADEELDPWVLDLLREGEGDPDTPDLIVPGGAFSEETLSEWNFTALAEFVFNTFGIILDDLL